MNKRGQGLPLNTIIIAIIVLVVLVVLIAIFVGRIGKTEQDLDREGNLESIKLKASYGKCRPSPTAESVFQTDYANPDIPKANAISNFQNLISVCKGRSDTDCQSSTDTKGLIVTSGGCSN